MSEIKRYRCGNVYEEPGIGHYVAYADHEAALAAAVQAERERCRKEEVEPLRALAKEIRDIVCLREGMPPSTIAIALSVKAYEALAAVKQVQKENP